MKTQVSAGRTVESLRILNAAIHSAAQLAMRDAVTASTQDAKATTLWRDRRPLTRSTIKPTVGHFRGEVRADGAAHFLEWGTKPHIIKGRNGGMLHFFVNGVEFFRRRVRHPGTKERPFMRQARERGEITAAYAADYYTAYAIEHAR